MIIERETMTREGVGTRIGSRPVKLVGLYNNATQCTQHNTTLTVIKNT